MPVCIEDECNSELPPASLLFRTARQYAYGVLFSLAETQRRLERLALRKRAPLEGKPSDQRLAAAPAPRGALAQEAAALLSMISNQGNRWKLPCLDMLLLTLLSGASW